MCITHTQTHSHDCTQSKILWLQPFLHMCGTHTQTHSCGHLHESPKPTHHSSLCTSLIPVCITHPCVHHLSLCTSLIHVYITHPCVHHSTQCASLIPVCITHPCVPHSCDSGCSVMPPATSPHECPSFDCPIMPHMTAPHATAPHGTALSPALCRRFLIWLHLCREIRD